MKTTFSKSLRFLFALSVVLWLVAPRTVADEARFFRIAGPVPTTITAVGADGYVTWTNVATNATFTVQTASSLLSESNWVDYVQVPATNGVTTEHLYAALVRSKFSCGLAIVEFQHASHSLARLDLAGAFADSVRRPRKENHIPFPLVISFTVKMKNVI
jgi:hypothetical protein